MLIKAFYSDPHFGHKNIIQYCQRPFESVHHMNEELISRYNNVISDTDTVIWLGDCGFCKADVLKSILERMNGRKILVFGNHDRSPGIMSSIGFDLVLEESFMHIAGRTCRLKHFPYIDGEPAGVRKDDRYTDKRPPKIKGEILIHGHTHSKSKVNKNMVHVGVDAWDYAPAMFSDVAALITSIT